MKPAVLLGLLCLAASTPVLGDTVIGGASADESPSIDVRFVRTREALERTRKTWPARGCMAPAESVQLPLVRIRAAVRFASLSDSKALLLHALDMPAYESVRYWSISRGRFRTLFSDSRFMDEFSMPSQGALRTGLTVPFRQNESGPLGAMRQLATVCAIEPGRVDIDIVNKGAARVFWMKAIAAGDYRLHIRMMRIEKDSNQWHFESDLLIAGSERAADPELRESYANRALALMAHLTRDPSIAEHYLSSQHSSSHRDSLSLLSARPAEHYEHK